MPANRYLSSIPVINSQEPAATINRHSHRQFLLCFSVSALYIASRFNAENMAKLQI
jgi:hypothetical protein